MSNILTLSKRGRKLIQNFEGLRLTAYKLPGERNWTIGFGHSSPEIRQGQVITIEEAEALFTRDVSKFTQGVWARLKVPTTQNQFDALVSFAYNVGLANFTTSSVLRFHNQKKFADVPKRLALWNKGSNMQVMPGLVKRRAQEGALYAEVQK